MARTTKVHQERNVTVARPWEGEHRGPSYLDHTAKRYVEISYFSEKGNCADIKSPEKKILTGAETYS